jgi:hypothetical protein
MAAQAQMTTQHVLGAVFGSLLKVLMEVVQVMDLQDVSANKHYLSDISVMRSTPAKEEA